MYDTIIEKEKIYQAVKKEKQNKTKKQLLKDFGDVPISFFMFLSSISLTINTIYWMKLYSDINLNIELMLRYNNIEPYYKKYLFLLYRVVFS